MEFIFDTWIADVKRITDNVFHDFNFNPHVHTPETIEEKCGDIKVINEYRNYFSFEYNPELKRLCDLVIKELSSMHTTDMIRKLLGNMMNSKYKNIELIGEKLQIGIFQYELPVYKYVDNNYVFSGMRKYNFNIDLY